MNPYSLRSLENDAICVKILLSTLTMKLSMRMFGNILTVGIVVITRSAGDLSPFAIEILRSDKPSVCLCLPTSLADSRRAKERWHPR